MNIQIQSLKFNADQKLLAFIEEKTRKLDRFYDAIVGAEVVLSIENTSDEKNKMAKIRLEVPGSDLFAENKCKKFESAVDQCIDTLKKQIEKHKEKMRNK
ncbi:MAG: ribosome hibernation-promoting factor, HPF/YfiA family [Bacteroidales bacterium]